MMHAVTQNIHYVTVVCMVILVTFSLVFLEFPLSLMCITKYI